MYVTARLSAALADRYTLERELGRGGMAPVYLAHDLKHGRHVALKVLRPELAASLGTDRFLRDIQVAAGLSHPHVLPLYDSGEVAGARPWSFWKIFFLVIGILALIALIALIANA